MGYYYYEEEEIFSGEEEKNESDDEIYQMKIKPRTKKVEKKCEGFDIDEFDRKIAVFTAEIHMNRKNMEYSKWVNKNEKNLQRLYNMSNLKTPVEDFYSYVYKNT